jgi:hypothetical protein
MKPRLDTITNLTFIALAVLIGAVVVKKNFLSQSAPAPPPATPGQRIFIAPGARLDVAGVDWKRNRQTLVLALSQGCHHCSAGAPFYRQLAAAAAERGLPMLALVPHAVEQGRKYLSDLQVPINDVRQVDLPALKIPGTPAVLLMDGEGKVEKIWPGKLSPDREAQVLAALSPAAQSTL